MDNPTAPELSRVDAPKPQAARNEPAATMGETLNVDLCIIGAGAGGLALATMASAFGLKVVLIEKHKMGGDSLNYGSVPSKTLIAAARRAQRVRTSADVGIEAAEPQVDTFAISRRIQSVVATLSPNASADRMAALGVRIIRGAARFIDKRSVAAGDYRVVARRIVVATGSSPVVPAIDGLADIPYYTPDTIFQNTRRIDHLLVLGAGASGLELSQAFRRLGSRVTVVESDRALREEDPELAGPVVGALRSEGIDILEGARVERFETVPGVVRAHVAAGDRLVTLDVSTVLVATGRRAGFGDLELARAGVKVGERGIVVDGGLRTSNRRVFAIGAAAGFAPQTHLAESHAETVLRRILFRLPVGARSETVPRVVFTDPELAHVGIGEAEALASKRAVNILRWPFEECDRAHIEAATEGHIKVLTDKRGRVLGATIAGRNASELIGIWALAVARGLNVRAMTQWVAPYPTFSSASRQAALRSMVTLPGNPMVRRIIAWLAKLG